MRALAIAGLVAAVLRAAPAVADAEAEAWACLEQSDNVTATLVARDWHSLLATSQTFLKDCKGKLRDSKMYYKNMSLKAVALRELGRPSEALAVTDACIKESYRTVDCHVERYAALKAVPRLEEAAAERERTLKLIDAELKRPGLEESERGMLMSMLSFLVRD